MGCEIIINIINPSAKNPLAWHSWFCDGSGMEIRRFSEQFRWKIFLLSLMSSSLFAAEIIAHRGASYDAPENTVASARLGWEQGADAVEIDIRVSADSRLIVLHDATTNRTTGRRGEIARLTAAEAQVRDAGTWKGARFAREKIPLLEDILAVLPEGGRLVIEIKSGPETVPLVAGVLANSGHALKQFVIIAFDPGVAAAAKQVLPACKVLRLASYEPRKPELDLDALIRTSKAAGLDGLNLSRKWPINPAFVRRVHAEGLSLYVWTVDAPAEARKLAAAGVDGITTNRPGWLRERLAAD